MIRLADHPDVLKAEKFCKAVMQGKRTGGRAAWEHPKDLVNLFAQILLYHSKYLEEEDAVEILQTCWLHDVLEDGMHNTKQRVERMDLVNADFSIRVVTQVIYLTKGDSRSRLMYLAGLSGLPGDSRIARFVKCLDRVCNLKEGAKTKHFDKDGWLRYVGETYLFIVPLTKDLYTEQIGALLRELLVSATRERACE